MLPNRTSLALLRRAARHVSSATGLPGQPLRRGPDGSVSPVEALWPIADLVRRRDAADDDPRPTRRPTDSLLRVTLPFSDPAYRAAFVNFRGHLRFGRILEELDFFAGTIAYLHCSDGSSTDVAALPTIVTASIDRVELLRFPLAADADLVMSGMVTATGRSSMNVDVDFTTAGGERPEVVLQASATFVARSRDNRALAVPPVVPVSDAERALNERGRGAMEARRAEREHSLDREPPSGAELAKVHALFLQGRSAAAAAASAERASAAAPGDGAGVCMSETRLSTWEITQPQGGPFGG